MQTFGKCPCNRLAPLDNGWCADCRQRLHIVPGPLVPTTVPAIRPTVAALMGALVAELEAEEVIDPLAQRFTLAGIWSDLARLADEPLPSAAAAIVGDTLDTPIDLRYLRGAAADEARTWPEFRAAAYLPAD